MTQRFDIGLTYPVRRGKGKTAFVRTYTIVDIYKTFNSAGECVDIQYVTEHTVCGQKIHERTLDITIAKALFAVGRLVDGKAV